MKKKGELGWKVSVCFREAPAVLLPAWTASLERIWRALGVPKEAHLTKEAEALWHAKISILNQNCYKLTGEREYN